MVSVIIAAHNEEAVLGRCLDALLEQGVPPTRIIVSANGCTDRTAEIAGSRGVTVVDRPEPGKAAALNAADRISSDYPRVYLDADIVVPAGGIAAVTHALAGADGPLAVAPRRRINTEGRPWPVRSYFAINERLPVFRNGLFGRGMFAISGAGRMRFTEFPDMTADDLFIDSQFTDAEKRPLHDVEIVVEAPHSTSALVARLVRVRRGNAQMRAATSVSGHAIRDSDRWSWLRDVVLPEPRLAFAAVPYVAITLWAAFLGRRGGERATWGRDDSTRSAPRPTGAQGAA